MRRRLLACLAAGGVALTAAAVVDGPPTGPAEPPRAKIETPFDEMLTRQLSGSDRGLTPMEAFGAAQKRREVLRQLTSRQAPGLAAIKWQFAGPSTIGGRVLDIAVDPAEPNTLYAATAAGGVFKSTDAGVTFDSVWPDGETQAIGALVMTPSGTLLAGTGETGPGGGSLTYGGTGVYRSTDRGKSWQRVGLENSGRISRIVVDPADEKRIFVAASGSLFTPGGARGIYMSENGGNSWTRVLAGENPTSGGTDIAFDPGKPGRVFAAMWDHQRTPSHRRYTGPGSGIYRSEDAGRTWTRVGGDTFAPSPSLGRIGLAVAPAPNAAVFAVLTGENSTQTFHRSTDGGDTFSTAGSITGSAPYGWWFSRVWVDPRDPLHVFVADLNLHQSVDGGQTFVGMGSPIGFGPAPPHVDNHALVWDPTVPGRVYLGNDGGVYRSDDNGVTFTPGADQPWSQLYDMDVAEGDPSRMVAALQDNGCQRSYPGVWNMICLGDGTRSRVNPGDDNAVYTCSQYGACAVDFRGGSPGAVAGTTISTEGTRRNWSVPIEFDPQDPTIVYSASEMVSRSEDSGRTWTTISPDLSGAPEPDPVYPNFGTVTTIAPAARASGTIYAGTDDGHLQYTHDGGASWTKATDPDLPKAWVTRVKVDPRDPKTAYATFSGFRAGVDAAYVLGTRDGGATWEDLTGNLPHTPLNDVEVIDDALVVGGDLGVYLSRDRGRSWYLVGSALPISPVHELRFHAPTKQLFAGTFGRGIYKIDYAAVAGVPLPLAGEPPVTKRKAKARRANLGLPARRRCGRPLRFKVKGKRLKTVTVRVGKRRVETLRGRALRRRVSLKLPRAAVTVRLDAVRRDGARLTQSRRYKRCRSQ